MKKNEHFVILEDDYLQAISAKKRILISLKLIYYSLQRPVADFFIRKKLKSYLVPEQILNYVDIFLKDEGGMFKKYVYGLCNRFLAIKNSLILIPGVGYGRNLMQLASYQPKKIVAFDLYEYKEEWDFLKQKIKERFDVEIIFLKGDFDVIDKNYASSFDFIITDAVLEHIKNLPLFLANSKRFLKNGGTFYASFGPIWWGPGGDHLNWGEKEMFNHLLLSEKEYAEQFNEEFKQEKIAEDSCEGTFLVQKKIFSFLKVEDYLNYLESIGGFKKQLAYANISQKTLSLIKENPNLSQKLNDKNVPLFDRFCKGIYLWLKLNK